MDRGVACDYVLVLVSGRGGEAFVLAEVAGLKLKWLGPEILLVAVSGMHKGFL
jgi:hypothetical protein